MSYDTWQEALKAMVYEAALDPKSELARLSRAATRLSGEPSGTGSPDSNGTVGAPGPLMTASGWRDPRRVVVCTTPDVGSNAYQGRILAILSRWSEEEGDEYILMVSFDSQTSRRLAETLYGPRGSLDMDGAGYSLTIREGAPPTT